MLEIIDNNLDRSDQVVALFSASFCGPCKVLKPLLEKMSPTYPNVKFVRVDIEQNMELTNEFKIGSVPTLIFFKDGEVKNRQVGLVTGGALNNLMTQSFQ